MAFKRLASELKQLKEPNYFYSVKPNENNFLIWNFKCTLPIKNTYLILNVQVALLVA